MTSFHADRPVPGLEPATTAIAVALVACALWTVVVWTTVPLTVRVDGRWETVRAGATVADLIDSGIARSPHGDVLKVGGGVAAPGRGGDPRVTVDGRQVRIGQRLYQGDVVVSARGLDVLERTEPVLVAIPVPREQSGTGPEVVVRQLGAAGLQRVRWGVISHEIEESSLVRPTTPMVVQRRPFPPGTKIVALTFDDGPWPGQTQRVLEILASENVKATFFMVGVRVRLAPELAKRVVEEGHVVANHTQTHQTLGRATPQQVVFQMTAGRDTLWQATGVETGWFRAPGGVVTQAVRVEATALGERIAGWTVDPADWRKPGVDLVIRRVVWGVRPGAIVLLHDGGGDRNQTIAALPEIIARLKVMGYRFVTLDELLPQG
jgi:peptidoglycan/xylan/chitin deacetylase (PgdA/CDA1 family)